MQLQTDWRKILGARRFVVNLRKSQFGCFPAAVAAFASICKHFDVYPAIPAVRRTAPNACTHLTWPTRPKLHKHLVLKMKENRRQVIF